MKEDRKLVRAAGLSHERHFCLRQQRNVAGAQRKHEPDLFPQSVPLVDLRLAAECDQRRGAGLRGERRQLSIAEHRRQRRRDGAAVKAREQRDGSLDRVASEQQDDVSATHGAGL